MLGNDSQRLCLAGQAGEDINGRAEKQSELKEKKCKDMRDSSGKDACAPSADP
jgi:hypothetical protein